MAVRPGAFAIALAVTVSASAAQAQPVTTQSPRFGMLKLKLGTYNPQEAVDSESGLSGAPYSTSFGKGGMLLGEVSYDYYAWSKIGTLGGGLSVGYAEKYAKATAAEDPTIEVKEKRGLRIAPVKLMAFYNFDYAAREWGVPLVPFARLGLIWMPWWSMKGGDVEYVDRNRFAGAKWGFGGSLGLMLELDFLERRLAHDLDTSMGINHSYFFAEYNLNRVDNFGGEGLNLSSNHWMFGLAFEF